MNPYKKVKFVLECNKYLRNVRSNFNNNYNSVILQKTEASKKTHRYMVEPTYQSPKITNTYGYILVYQIHDTQTQGQKKKNLAYLFKFQEAHTKNFDH